MGDEKACQSFVGGNWENLCRNDHKYQKSSFCRPKSSDGCENLRQMKDHVMKRKGILEFLWMIIRRIMVKSTRNLMKSLFCRLNHKKDHLMRDEKTC